MSARRAPHAFLATIALALGTALVRAASGADPLPASAEHVALPGRPVASDDTTEALLLDPANLAWLPAPEVRWAWIRCPEQAVKVGCGDAWALAAPLPFGLATAGRVDLVQPSGALSGPGAPVDSPFRVDNFVWITWGVAARLGEHAAFGLSLERSYSQRPRLDGLFGVTAALSWRPDPHVGLAAVAHDFNRPSAAIAPPATPATEALPVLDGRYALAAAIRPTGRRDLEIGLEAQYWQGADEWTARGTLGVDVPGVGRAFGSAELAHMDRDARRAVVGTAGLEFHFEGVSAGGGALFGDGLGGGRDTVGEYADLAIAGYAAPGIPRPARAVWLRIESTPSTRGHVALLRRLWQIADARDVDAVTLVLRAEPASSLAHAEELADAIRVLRARGKKVLCSWEDAGAVALYACASADRIAVSPAGGLRYAGLRSEYVYLKGLLDKLGVQADFVRIGPHKTAPEQFTNEHAGPVAHEDHLDLLRQREAVFDRNLALYRHLDPERVAAVARTGPFVATEARAAGLVDVLAFDDELERTTRELVGRDIAYRAWHDEAPAPAAFGPRGRIGLLYLDGDIVDGRSQHVPIVDMRLVGSYTMVDAIREVRDDRTVRAVVLRIESPGGSSLASDVMWRELMLLAKKKPLVVSMGSVAASGGYYVASASRNVFALPLTVTGSIGVFYGKADVSGLLAKIGVTVDTYKTAPRADAESIFRGFTADEERELHHKVEQFYDTFLDRVSEGRGMAKEAVDAVGRGRVWMGQQAILHHLVDHLGGLRDALQAARAAADLPDDAPLLELPRENPSLLELAAGLVTGGGRANGDATLPPAVRDIARAVAPLLVYGDDEPLARMELAPIE